MQPDDGIQWDDASADSGITWDAPTFDNVQAGRATTAPNASSFGPVNVNRGTMPQLQDFSPEGMALDSGTAETVAKGAKDIAGEIESGAQGIGEDYQYAPDGRRVVGIGEGFARRLGEDVAGMGKVAGYLSPDPMAGAAIRQGAGETEQALAIDPEKERFSGARAEAIATGGPDILTNLPLERLAGVAAKVLRSPFARNPAVKDAALVGELGPAAKGAATGDEIVQQALDGVTKDAGKIDVTPELRVPAEAAPDARGNARVFPGERAAVVPDAALDAPAAAAEAPAGVPPGDLPPRAPAPAAMEAERAAGAPVEAGPVRTPDAPPEAGVAPEPLYHASLTDFDHFAAGTEGTASDPGVFGRGHYATGDERLAPMYLGPRKSEGTLYTLENRMENPKVFDSPAEAVEWQGERGTDSPEAADRVRQKYLDAGHDGAIVRNPKTGRTMEAVAFDPEKLKVASKRRLGEPPAPEPTPEAGTKSAIAETESAITDTTDVYHTELGKLKDELGWQEQGGRMIRGPQDYGENLGAKAEVTGRTKWVAKSDFWPAYRARDPNPLTEAEAARALEKMGAGEKLTKREERFGAFAKETASQRAGDYGEALQEHHTLSQQDYERGARASVRDVQRAAEEEVGTHAEAIRSDEGQVRGAGRDEAGRGGRSGADLQRPAEGGRKAFAERVPQAGEGEVPRDDAAAPGLKEPGQTGIYNAHVAEERARRGFEEVKHDLTRGDQEVWHTAQARLRENPTAGRDLASEIVRTKRPPNAEEVHTLILDRQRIKNERRIATERAELAQDAGDTEKAAAERAKIQDLDEQYEMNDKAARYSAHEQGLAFRARMAMSREDYSLAHMVQSTKVKAATRLTAADEARLAARSREVEAAEAALAKREQALRDERAKTKSPFGVKDARKRFDSLAEELKKIADKDQLTPGCIV